MKRIVTASIALSTVLAALVIAQTRTPQPVKDEIPEAALLTQRGAELADRLKWLRRSEQSMGKNNPSLPEVREQIEGVLGQLKAWAPAPDTNTIEGSDLKRKVPQMNDEDLRQLVLQLVQQVADLQTRVGALERRR